MLQTLPGWVVEDAQSIRDEAAPYINMTPSERLQDVRAACRGAMKLLAARGDADLVLAYRDPMPDSTRLIYQRLMAQRAARVRA